MKIRKLGLRNWILRNKDWDVVFMMIDIRLPKSFKKGKYLDDYKKRNGRS